MEPNFQTSFIPKKPIIEKRDTPARSVNIFVIGAIFVLFAVLIATVGLYFYRVIVNKNLAQMQVDLNLAKDRFEPSKITQLQVLDNRLVASTEILAKHVSVTPIFDALQAITMKSVSYTKFAYDFSTNSTTGKTLVSVKMSGTAIGYRSVALQSDLFGQNKNLIDPVFSNLTLDDKGNVVFDLDFSVDPSFVNYKAVLAAQS